MQSIAPPERPVKAFATKGIKPLRADENTTAAKSGRLN
jgi:hypothetical protein